MGTIPDSWKTLLENNLRSVKIRRNYMDIKEKVTELEKGIEQLLSTFESDSGFTISYIGRMDNRIRLSFILNKR